MDFVNQIIHGDCERVLEGFPDDSIDLIFTSPPYADRRKKTYGGVKPGEYMEDRYYAQDPS
jgi:DNA modification methylase